jgi:hypothetical protein
MTIEQIAALSIQEHDGYCLVSSCSTPGKKYRVEVDPRSLYSTYCHCRDGRRNSDCGHRIGVDRHYDDRRWAILRFQKAQKVAQNQPAKKNTDIGSLGTLTKGNQGFSLFR